MAALPEAEKFLKGIALSIYQNSGDGGKPLSNWTEFIKEKQFLGQRKYTAAFAKASNFWDMYEKDIKSMKEMGATAFRVSFEWARLQPNGPSTELDPAAVERYSQIFECIRANGLEPMVTLHHFTHPAWFEHLGGFAEEANLHHFETYSAAVFRTFGPRIKLWSTFNEPTCFAFVGYIVGLWAPGKVMRLNQCGVVLGNLLKAHCRVYRALKQMPGGQEAAIGLVHQHIKFYPRNNWPHIRALAKWMTFWFGSYSVLKFFSTGIFEWDNPFHREGPKEQWRDEGVVRGEKVVDWWGINYYSRPCIQWNFSMGPSDANEPCSDTDFRLYPQGMYESIKDASILKVPIYITETGLADKADRYRGWYIKASYAMLLKAIADGYDVRGVFWWTLLDNIEWHEGFHIKFGLFQWEPEFADLYKDNNNRPPTGLKLREGSKALVDVYHTWPDKLEDLRAYAKQQPEATITAILQPIPHAPPTAKPVPVGPGTAAVVASGNIAAAEAGVLDAQGDKAAACQKARDAGPEGRAEHEYKITAASGASAGQEAGQQRAGEEEVVEPEQVSLLQERSR